MKKLLLIIFVCLITGCQTSTPDGWDKVDPILLSEITEATGTYLATVVEDTDTREYLCIVSSGAIGITTYNSAIYKGLSKEKAILASILAMQSFSKDNFKDVLDNKNLTTLLLEQFDITLDVNEAEVWVGFLLYLLNHPDFLDPAHTHYNLLGSDNVKASPLRWESIK